jgi:hypothetical protein
MGHLRAHKVVGKRMGHTTCRNLDVASRRTKHILLEQNIGPNSKFDQNTRNLGWEHDRSVPGAVLQVDKWGPKRRDGMGLLVGSSVVVDDSVFVQERCH